MSEKPEKPESQAQQPEETQAGNETPKKRQRPSLPLLFFPTILATTMLLIENAVCKLFVFIISNTIGMAEGGEDLVRTNFSAGTMPAILIYFVFPHIVELIRKNYPTILPDSTLKWAARGIVLGALLFIVISTISATCTINETSALKISHAITATGILIWIGLIRAFNGLFAKKLKEEIGL